MIEKLISLAVTQSHHQMIINQIPDYCFDKLKQTLQIYTEIQFLSYDRDDLDPVHHLSFPHPKSAVDVDEKISPLIFVGDEINLKRLALILVSLGLDMYY